MIGGKRILAIIPARGGSKGIPRKNIKEIAGKPLIGWTIEVAKQSRYIDRIILSSEDDEIIKLAQEWGCEVPFKRPLELASDNSSGVDPVIHALEMLPGYDYLVLLQPTSPLRLVEDIDGCIEKCFIDKTNAYITVCKTEKHPMWMYQFDEEGFLKPIIDNQDNLDRRQDLPAVYLPNGAVYVVKVKWFFENRKFITTETKGFEMPVERSVDIDNIVDFMLAEQILLNRRERV